MFTFNCANMTFLKNTLNFSPVAGKEKICSAFCLGWLWPTAYFKDHLNLHLSLLTASIWVILWISALGNHISLLAALYERNHLCLCLCLCKTNQVWIKKWRQSGWRYLFSGLPDVWLKIDHTVSLFVAVMFKMHLCHWLVKYIVKSASFPLLWSLLSTNTRQEQRQSYDLCPSVSLNRLSRPHPLYSLTVFSGRRWATCILACRPTDCCWLICTESFAVRSVCID